MIVAVHGAGYCGLTGAIHFAKKGITTIAYDPDEEVVKGINLGYPKAREFLGYLGGPAGMNALISWPKTNGGLPKLRATTNLDEVIELSNVHVLDVPSERHGMPYLDIVEGSFAMLCRKAPSTVPIIVESTVQPGTAAKLRILAGPRPWAIAPRRDWFADPNKNLETLVRVVGVDAQHQAVISAIVEAVSPTVRYCTPETAEVTKALENALFHGSVMLVHQLSRTFPNHDLVEAAALAVTHWRFESYGSLYPSIGSGGRCIPLGARYLSTEKTHILEAALDEDFIETPNAVSMVVDSARPKHVLVLGVGYRPGFADAGNSPGLRLIKHLDNPDGPAIFVHDPHFSTGELKVILEHEGLDAPHIHIAAKPELNKDVIVLATGHPEYKDLWQAVPATTRVLDATGLWEGKLPAERYRRPGRPGWLHPWS